MINWILTLLLLSFVVHVVIGDSFRDISKFSFKDRLRRTLTITTVLFVFAVYTSLDEVVLNDGHRSLNPYIILGVGRTASRKEIMSQSRQLAKLYHPDRNDSPDAAMRFDSIRQASKLLLNDNWRVGYDRYGDSLKPEYLESAMAHPNMLLMLFLWDSIRHTVNSLFIHTVFLLKEIKQGRFEDLVTYVIILGGLQSAILILRFSPLKSDAEFILSVTGGGAWASKVSLSEQIPFVRNLTMFQRTRLLASLGPLLLTVFRLVQPSWMMLADEYHAIKLHRAWYPVDWSKVSELQILRDLVEMNKAVNQYCRTRTYRILSITKDDQPFWNSIQLSIQRDKIWDMMFSSTGAVPESWKESIKRETQQMNCRDIQELVAFAPEKAKEPVRSMFGLRSAFIVPLLVFYVFQHVIGKER